MKAWRLLALSLAAWAPGARAAGALESLELEQQALFQKVAPTVVLISRGDVFGSGFFVSRDGLVLTNAHVVGTAQAVSVILNDGRKLEGKVLERGKDKVDLALVQVALKGAPTLAVSGISSVRVGSWVAAVGHGRGAAWTFNTGMISNIYPDGAERPVFQTQIPLNPGNSGGPIVDRLGRVVGVVTAGDMTAQALNFGISMEVAERSLERLSRACECFVVEAPPGVPVFVDESMAGTGPRVVVPAATHKSYRVFAVIGGQRREAQVAFPAQREIVFK